MSNPVETERNGKHDVLSPEAAQRISELESRLVELQEKYFSLEKEHERDKELLKAYVLADFPQSEEEYREFAAEARPFSELLETLDREYGSESVK